MSDTSKPTTEFRRTETSTELHREVFQSGDGGLAVSLIEDKTHYEERLHENSYKLGEDGKVDFSIPKSDYVEPAYDRYSYQLKFSLSHYGIRMDQQVFIGPETIDHLLFVLGEAKKGWARNKKTGYRPDPKYVPRNRDDGSSEIKIMKF